MENMTQSRLLSTTRYIDINITSAAAITARMYKHNRASQWVQNSALEESSQEGFPSIHPTRIYKSAASFFRILLLENDLRWAWENSDGRWALLIRLERIYLHFPIGFSLVLRQLLKHESPREDNYVLGGSRDMRGGHPGKWTWQMYIRKTKWGVMIKMTHPVFLQTTSPIPLEI